MLHSRQNIFDIKCWIHKDNFRTLTEMSMSSCLPCHTDWFIFCIKTDTYRRCSLMTPLFHVANHPLRWVEILLSPVGFRRSIQLRKPKEWPPMSSSLAELQGVKLVPDDCSWVDSCTVPSTSSFWCPLTSLSLMCAKTCLTHNHGLIGV